MSPLADRLHAAAIAELVDLATTASGGPVALLSLDGELMAGTRPAAGSRRTHPVVLDGMAAGTVMGPGDADPSLLMLLSRSLELAVGAAHEAASRARFAEELAIGRRIQSALIPRRFPEVEGWDFAAAYEPAREVGGDLYDAFALRGRTDRIGLLIADVTGKGIPAALLMADVRALLHAATDNADGPVDALGRVNRILVAERATSLFVTAALLVVDTTTGAVRYGSAGHESPLIVRSDGTVEMLEAEGPLLGAFAKATFQECWAQLGPGDAVVLYTDGVTETRDVGRSFYGEAAFEASLAAASGHPALGIRDAVMAPLRAFRGEAEPFDDLALLVMARHPGP
jgi:phosphoserine phosphatase RsbU/P